MPANGRFQRAGLLNLAEDWGRLLTGTRLRGTEAFIPGETIAISPGEVVCRTPLMELIQYAPVTASVHAEPVLLVPSWLLKYYILDLSPENSLVRYLVGQGHTVFAISWRNPGPDDRDLTLNDYRTSGLEAAINAVRSIVENRPVHAVGYCLGGTLLTLTAAALARRGETPFRSLTLLAALVDFEGASAGLPQAAITGVVELMRLQGYLDSRQIIAPYLLRHGAGQLAPLLFRRYVMGDAEGVDDIMAWRTDPTRIPWRVHAEVLERFYGTNDIARGCYEMDGAALSVGDIDTPVFGVAATDDQVAPWRSVFRGLALFRHGATLLLATGNHQSAIIGDPAGNASYRMTETSTVIPDGMEQWAAASVPVDGAWWSQWSAWLVRHSSGPSAPAAMGNVSKGLRPLCAAPGTFVHGH